MTFRTPFAVPLPLSLRLALVAVACLPAASVRAGAQRPTVLTIGSPEDDARRLAQLRARGASEGASLGTAGVLLRDGATLVGAPGDTLPGRFAVLLPQLRVVRNGALATSLNEGALWSGRGTSALVRAGVAVRLGPLHATLAPELVHSANRPVEVLAGKTPGWSAWSSPWRSPAVPADLPLRFGNAPITAVAPGQSRVELSRGALAVGISSANLWWGPGVRNALVLSNHADGVPHALLRTARPLQTRVGAFEARWMAGRLTESLYFDRDPANDRRALGGMAVTWAPRWVDGATVGVTRLVVRRLEGRGVGGVLGGGAAAAVRAALPFTDAARTDQMQGAFLRWVLPEDGVEFWGEYATMRLPTLREWLVAPNANAGWTLGSQWLLPASRPGDGRWRLQLEITDVAQSKVLAGRDPRDWGTGTAAVQGFTQRGRMLGVSTGPGSSHWWLAMDRWHPAWTAGGFLSRTRWENDALYREPFPSPFAHDVSFTLGVRASGTAGAWRPQAVVSLERRYNYQFESSYLVPLGRGQRTVNNARLELTVYPALPGNPGRR